MTTTMPSHAPMPEPGELARPHWATRSLTETYGVYHLRNSTTVPVIIDPCTEQPGDPMVVELSQADHLEYDRDGAFTRIRRTEPMVFVGSMCFTPDEACRLHAAIGEVLDALAGGAR